MSVREPARVLVIDDDRDFRESIATVLAQANHLVTCVDTATGALHMLRCADTPDLMVCDIHMPALDGYALLERARARRETEYTPIIFVSGDPDERIQALQRGGNDFMLKPIDPPELIARVECQLRTARTSRTWRRYSFVDPLTGLLNRRGFADPIAREVDRATRHHTSLSVVFIDLDGFKAVNDSQGHEIGDDILQRFARILEQNLRGSDLAARWGGDEFVLGLPGSDRKAARRVSERIRASAARDFVQLPTPLGVSIGIACLFEDNQEAGRAVASELIQCADHAMYLDKREHRRFAAGSNPNIPAIEHAPRPRRETEPWVPEPRTAGKTNRQEWDR